MKLCSTKVYLEAGTKFLVSHKVNNFIVAQLTERIMVPYKLDRLNPEVFLNLQVNTNSQCMYLKVDKPEGVHDDFLTWRMWLPYKKVVNSINYLDEYINSFFDAASQVFAEFGVDKDAVLSVKEIIKAEVLDNPDYEFTQKRVSKVAKYDFD